MSASHLFPLLTVASDPPGTCGQRMFIRESEMASRLRHFDWSSTPLGSSHPWPQSLQGALGICLNSRFPMAIFWGPNLLCLYNDDYIPVLGRRHPEALGRAGKDVWAEIWPLIGSQVEAVLQDGQATWSERVHLVVHRNGFAEPAWFTWSYSAIPNEEGGVGGVFCTCIEETARVLAEHERDKLAQAFRETQSQLQAALSASEAGTCTWDDFTDRKRGEDLTKESEQRLRRQIAEFETLLDVIPVGIGIALDNQCLTVRTNRAFSQMLGLQKGQNASKTAPEEERPATFRCIDDSGLEIPSDQLPMQTAAREGRPLREIEVNIVRDDGFAYRLLEYAAPLFDEHGLSRGCVAAFVDVTQRRQAEARARFLLELDGALRPLTAPEEITLSAATLLGQHLGVDRCAYADIEPDGDTINITGNYMRDESIQSIVGRLKFADFGEEVLALMRLGEPYVVNDVDHHMPPVGNLSAYRSIQIQAVICVPLYKDQKFVAAMAVHSTRARVWKEDEVGLLQQVASRCWESILRAWALRELRESEDRFRQMANSIPQLAWMARPDGSIFWYNDRWYEYTGTSFEQMQGRGWENVHDPDELKRVVSQWSMAVVQSEVWEDTFPLRRADGVFRWHLSRARPLRDAAGAIALWFGTNTDIEDERQMKVEREHLLEAERAARAGAERVSRMKDEFLATLGHELRTPLTSILGWSHLLRSEPIDNQEIKHGLEVIERNAKAQAQLIEDLLDMSRIISGKVRLDVQRVELSAIVAAAIESVQPTADAKGVRLEKILDPLAGAVSGDPGRLQQVFWNLLSNAIKFTPKGGRVQVLLQRVNSHIEIVVSDTGQGIQPEFLPHVFDRFAQADGSTSRKHGGLGLGLSIVRQLVEMHNGTARVQSLGEGHGATFLIALPLAILQSEEKDRQHPTSESLSSDDVFHRPLSLEGLRILVVDDDPDAREIVRRVLEGAHAAVLTAGSAAEGLELFHRETFQVIVSDIGMPGTDGYEFIGKIRALGAANGGAVPAIALTAFARSEDRRRALLAGYQSHIAKPVEPAELVTVIASVTGRTMGVC